MADVCRLKTCVSLEVHTQKIKCCCQEKLLGLKDQLPTKVPERIVLFPKKEIFIWSWIFKEMRINNAGYRLETLHQRLTNILQQENNIVMRWLALTLPWRVRRGWMKWQHQPHACHHILPQRNTANICRWQSASLEHRIYFWPRQENCDQKTHGLCVSNGSNL